MSLLKKVFYRLYSWLYRRKFTGAASAVIDFIIEYDRTEPSGGFAKMVDLRKKEIPLNRPPRKLQVTGDSIIHNAEPLFEAEGLICTAIGGDNSRTFLERLEDNILPYCSDVVIIDLLGNDGLAGEHIELSFARFEEAVGRLRVAGVRHIAWFDILPLGNPCTATEEVVRDNAHVYLYTNFEFAPKIIDRVRKSGIVDIIPVREKLQDRNFWIKPEYQLPDRIHCNRKAYEEVYIPATRNYLRSRGY